ncbi:hypothetical protein L2735_02670 [Shewanella olleyana]|uniref:hypothetical protein n=1 Tax=Shewanella olleyana TaxID=135626 RepID=UPI00200CF6F1|nr:hypothetical protein [Shewanella olleyana]MCL1065711.1 hypothetical protein [Shewanella olleyana]
MRPVKLMKLYIKAKWVWPIRIICLFISAPFLHKVYTAFSTGIAESSRYTSVQGEDWGFYAFVFKYMAFAFLFVWLGTFGTKEKRVEGVI